MTGAWLLTLAAWIVVGAFALVIVTAIVVGCVANPEAGVIIVGAILLFLALWRLTAPGHDWRLW